MRSTKNNTANVLPFFQKGGLRIYVPVFGGVSFEILIQRPTP